jgi:hypothetical protein
MSNQHLSLVREIDGIKGPSRAVLNVLADRANDSGTAWPSWKTLQRESGFSRSAIHAALNDLKRRGLVSWTNRRDESGDLTSNLYTLTLNGGSPGDGLGSPPDGLGVVRETDGGSPGGGRRSIKEASTEASLLAELIYQVYPRKAAKKNGIKAILKAMKENNPDFLLERTKAYASAIGWKERRFIPHPATWFNGESFNDDPDEWKQPVTNGAKPKPTKADEFKL